MRRLLATLLVVLSFGAASAQQAPSPPATTAPAAAENVSIHGFGDSDKTCLEWNDGCRTCRRPEGAEPFCSNIAIACQPMAIQCTRRAEPPK